MEKEVGIGILRALPEKIQGHPPKVQDYAFSE